MKSTNRQIHLKNQKLCCVKMCLLNLVLISFVTLTQCVSIPPPYLSAAIHLHPGFSATLLDKTVVPYLEECETSSVKGGNSEKDKTKMLCGSYLEMMTILDANKIDTLKNKTDFDIAMNTYDEKNVGEFCTKFSKHIPKDPEHYPESNKLFKFVENVERCQGLCLDTDVLTFSQTVKPFCRLIAYGFLHSERLPQSNTTANEVNNSEFTNSIPAIARVSQNLDLKNSSQKRPNSSLVTHHDVNAEKPEIPSGNKVEEKNKNTKIGINEAAKQSDTSSKLPGKPTDAVEQSPVEAVVTEGSNPNEQPGEEKFAANVDETLQSMSDKSKTVTSDDENSLFNDPDDGQANINPVKDKLSNDDDQNDNIIEDGDETKRIDNDDDDDDDDRDEISAQNNNNNNIPDKFVPEQSPSIEQSPSKEQLLDNPFYNDPDSNFFTYFMFILLACVIAYVVYHNKTKILALMLEGRRSSTSGRSGLSRRKHTAAYRKLDSNLEEAITSSANNRSTDQVIY